MVFLLGVHVSEEGVELARAHRKRAVAALPVEVAIVGGEALDPFRGCFLQPFEHVRLGESSRQRRYQMDMISHAADTEGFRARVAANGRKIGVHSGPDVGVQPRVAVFCAEYNMNDDFAKRLRHGGTIADEGSWMNRAFSAGLCACVVPGALPPGFYESRAVGAKRIQLFTVGGLPKVVRERIAPSQGR